jgi:hypothetical protein
MKCKFCYVCFKVKTWLISCITFKISVEDQGLNLK